jgi:hypothetical protein
MSYTVNFTVCLDQWCMLTEVDLLTRSHMQLLVFVVRRDSSEVDCWEAKHCESAR